MYLHSLISLGGVNRDIFFFILSPLTVDALTVTVHFLFSKFHKLAVYRFQERGLSVGRSEHAVVVFALRTLLVSLTSNT